MASVQYDTATRLYPGTPRPAVNELSIEIADGELLVLVGPSGSGKSTALRMLAGLEPLDGGRDEIADAGRSDQLDRRTRDGVDGDRGLGNEELLELRPRAARGLLLGR